MPDKPEEIGADVDHRPLIATDTIAGDRYYDWRNGCGREEVGDLFRDAVPTAEAPVTLILVAFTGKAIARLVRETKRG